MDPNDNPGVVTMDDILGEKAPSRSVFAPKAPGSNPTSLSEIDQLLKHPNVRKMADAIGWSEGADYDTMFGGGKLSDFSDHPRKVNTVGNLRSSAAGKGQFLQETWDEAANNLGLEDFSPANQDRAMVYLMKKRGMIDPILKGDWDTAIHRGNREWASLPGSPYGQKTRSLDQIKQQLEGPGFGSQDPSKLYAPGGPQDPSAKYGIPPTPENDPAAQAEEKQKRLLSPVTMDEVEKQIEADPSIVQRARQSVQGPRQAPVYDRFKPRPPQEEPEQPSGSLGENLLSIPASMLRGAGSGLVSAGKMIANLHDPTHGGAVENWENPYNPQNIVGYGLAKLGQAAQDYATSPASKATNPILKYALNPALEGIPASIPGLVLSAAGVPMPLAFGMQGAVDTLPTKASFGALSAGEQMTPEEQQQANNLNLSDVALGAGMGAATGELMHLGGKLNLPFPRAADEVVEITTPSGRAILQPFKNSIVTFMASRLLSGGLVGSGVAALNAAEEMYKTGHVTTDSLTKALPSALMTALMPAMRPVGVPDLGRATPFDDGTAGSEGLPPAPPGLAPGPPPGAEGAGGRSLRPAPSLLPPGPEEAGTGTPNTPPKSTPPAPPTGKSFSEQRKDVLDRLNKGEEVSDEDRLNYGDSHHLTKEEWFRRALADRKAAGAGQTISTLPSYSEHADAVKRAIKAGKYVPDSVRKEYGLPPNEGAAEPETKTPEETKPAATEETKPETKPEPKAEPEPEPKQTEDLAKNEEETKPEPKEEIKPAAKEAAKPSAQLSKSVNEGLVYAGTTLAEGKKLLTKNAKSGAPSQVALMAHTDPGSILNNHEIAIAYDPAYVHGYSNDDGSHTLTKVANGGATGVLVKNNRQLQSFVKSNPGVSLDTAAAKKVGDHLWIPLKANYIRGEAKEPSLENKLAKAEPEAKPVEETKPEPAAPHDHFKAATSILSGTDSLDTIKRNYSLLRQHEEQVKAALRKLTIPDLYKTRLVHPSTRGSKNELVDAAYSALVGQYAMGEAVGYDPFKGNYHDAVGKALHGMTEGQLEEKRLARQKHVEELKRALNDPQTLEDFNTFVRYKGKDALSEEQRYRYEDLQAAETRKLKQQPVAKPEPAKSGEMEIVKHFHTKKNQDVWIARLPEKVDDQAFSSMKAEAKKLGGWYSRAWQGSPNGFAFPSEDAAEAFRDLYKAPAEGGQNVKPVEPEKKPPTVAVSRLRETAQRTIAKAEEEMDRPRLTNTNKRSEQAAGALEAAAKAKAIGETMLRLADAIEKGEAPNLAGLTSRADVERLTNLLGGGRTERQRADGQRYDSQEPLQTRDADYAKYPWPQLHLNARDREKIADALAPILGGKRAAAAFLKQFDKESREGRLVSSDHKLAETIVKILKGMKGDHRIFGYYAEEYTTVRRLGLDNLVSLKSALREFLDFSQAAKKNPEAELRKREQELARQKIPGFFPTPKPVIDDMLERADIKPGMSVLEPSAGRGDIVKAIEKEVPGAEVSAIEFNYSLNQFLQDRGYNVLPETNFLNFTNQKFDRIVMNPPFEKGQDIEHVRHAFDLLKPGGRVVAIMSEGPFFRNDKQATDFRKWLESVGGESEKNPEGAFKESDRSTGVATRIVTIEKPAEKVNAANNKAAHPSPASKSAESTKLPTKTPEVISPWRGRDTEIIIPGEDTTLPGYYALSRRGDIISSHNGITFQPNERYKLAGITNERDYGLDTNQGPVLKATQPGKFKPELVISNDPTAVNGPPVTDQYGLALGGNSRLMMLERFFANASKEEKANYKQQLRNALPFFGFSPEDIEKAMAHDDVVLHRVIETNTKEAQSAISKLNIQPGKALSESEAAASLAKQAPPEFITYLGEKLADLGDEATVANLMEGKAGAAIIREMVEAGIIPEQQLALYVKNGEATAGAKDLIEKLMLGRIVPSTADLNNLSKSDKNTLIRIAPAVTATAGTGWDIAADILPALRYISGAKNARMSLDEWKNQIDLFTGKPVEVTDTQLRLAQALNELKPRSLQSVFKQYAQAYSEYADPTPLLFGEKETQEQAFQRLFPAPGEVPLTTKVDGLYSVTPEGRKMSEQESAKLTVAGATLIAEGVKSYQNWSAKMKEEFGTNINTHLGRLWQRAQAIQTHVPLNEILKGIEQYGTFRDWYERHRPVVDALFGEDAALFYKILAATSPHNTVKGNVTMAVKAYRQMKAGLPFHGYLPSVVGNLERIRGGLELQGEKTTNFHKALSNNDLHDAAVDMHIAELISGTSRPTPADHKKAQMVMREIAKAHNWGAKEIQAVMWAFNQIRKGKELASVDDYEKAIQDKLDEIQRIRAEYAGGADSGSSISTSDGEGYKGQATGFEREHAIAVRTGGRERTDRSLNDRLAASVVRDAEGQPIRVYRGEHGQGAGQPTTRLGSISFSSDPDVASTYAMYPNDHRDTPQNPLIIPAYLDITNPFLNDPDDPFMDLSKLKAVLSPEDFDYVVNAYSDHIMNTSNWDEDFSPYYSHPTEAIADDPANIDKLYLDAYPILDDFRVINALKQVGFDGAIYGGSGESAMTPEYRVFDAKQIIPAFEGDKAINYAAMGFFSQLETAVANLKQPVMPVKDWIAKLKDPKLGITKAELEWSGIIPWLEGQEGKLNKDQILEHVRQNSLELLHVTYGGPRAESNGLPKFSDYAYEFPEDVETGPYKEVLLNLPSKGSRWAPFLEELLDEHEKLVAASEAARKEVVNEIRDKKRKESATVLNLQQQIEKLIESSPLDPEYWEKAEQDHYNELLRELRNAERLLESNLPGESTSLYSLSMYYGATKKQLAKATDLSEKVQLYGSLHQKIARISEGENVFRSNHWTALSSDESNLLHMRFTHGVMINGKKTLVLHEMQSDVHQRGRDKGYRQPVEIKRVREIVDKLNELEASIKSLDREMYPLSVEADELFKQLYDPRGGRIEEISNKRKALLNKMDEIAEKLSDQRLENSKLWRELQDYEHPEGAPKLPFSDSRKWTALGLKRALRYAIETGHDAFAWDDGNAQANIYSMAGHVDMLRFFRSIGPKGEEYAIHGQSPADESPRYMQSGIKADELADYVGQAIAEKVLAHKFNNSGDPFDIWGDDLKVDPKGMVTYYSTVIPSVIKDVAKAWKPDIRTIKLNTLRVGQSELSEAFNQKPFTSNKKEIADGWLEQKGEALNKGLMASQVILEDLKKELEKYEGSAEQYPEGTLAHSYEADIRRDLKETEYEIKAYESDIKHVEAVRAALQKASNIEELVKNIREAGEWRYQLSFRKGIGSTKTLLDNLFTYNTEQNMPVIDEARQIERSLLIFDFPQEMKDSVMQRGFPLWKLNFDWFKGAPDMSPEPIFGGEFKLATFKRSDAGAPEFTAPPMAEMRSDNQLLENVQSGLTMNSNDGYAVVWGNDQATSVINHLAEAPSYAELPFINIDMRRLMNGVAIKAEDAAHLAQLIEYAANRTPNLSQQAQQALMQLAAHYKEAAENNLPVAFVNADPHTSLGYQVQMTKMHEAIHTQTPKIDNEWAKLDKDAEFLQNNVRFPYRDMAHLYKEALAYIGSGEMEMAGFTGKDGARRAAELVGRVFQHIADEHGAFALSKFSGDNLHPKVEEVLENVKRSAKDREAISRQAKSADTARSGLAENGQRVQGGLSVRGQEGSGEGGKPVRAESADFALNAKAVADKLASVWEGIKGPIQEHIFPGTIGPDARIGEMVARRWNGDMTRRFDQAVHHLETVQKIMEGLPDHPPIDLNKVYTKAEQQKFLESRWGVVFAIETGNIDKLQPGLQPVAKMMEEFHIKRRKEVQALGVGALEKFYEHYFPHMYKDPKRANKIIAEYFSKRPFEGSKNFLKHRSIPTLEHARAYGLEPADSNPVQIMLLKDHEMLKFIRSWKIRQELKPTGLMRAFRERDKIPDGWEKIDDAAFTIYGPSPIPGSVTTLGHIYATRGLAAVLNNFLSPGLSGNPAYRTYRALGNVLNQAQLGLSFFHLGFTTIDAAISTAGVGLEYAKSGQGAKSIAALTKAVIFPWAAIDGIRTGQQLKKAWLEPGKWGQEWDFLAQAYEAAGGRIKMDDFYRVTAARQLIRALRDGGWMNVLKAIGYSPAAFAEMSTKLVMEHIVPLQKLGAFAQLAQAQLANNPNWTLQEKIYAMQRVADSIDNRLGQVIYDNIFWNKTVKDVLMASLRAVGWNLGTVREVGGGLYDTAKFLSNAGVAAKRKIGGGSGGKLPPKPPWERSMGEEFSTGKPQFTPRMGYLVGLALISAVPGALLNYLMTGEWPKDLKDVYFPRTGELDDEGNPARWSIPSYIKDIVGYAAHPGGTIASKIHPMLQLLNEILVTNKDHYGIKVYEGKPLYDSFLGGDDTPLYEKLWDSAKHVAKAAIPFSFRNVQEEGERTGDQWSLRTVVPPFVGITPARKEINRSPAQQLAKDLSWGHGGGGDAMTEEQYDMTRYRRNLRVQIQNNKNVDKQIEEGLKTGKLTARQAKDLEETKLYTPLQKSVQRLGVKDFMKVYEVATPAEREQIRDYADKKERLIDELPTPEAKRVRQQWEKLFPSQ